MIARLLAAPEPGGKLVQQRPLASVPHAPTRLGNYGVHVGLTHLLAEGRTASLRHEAPEVVVVLSGELEMEIDGVLSRVRAGDHFVIPADSWHCFANSSGSEATMLFAFGGDPGPITTHGDGLRLAP